MSCNSCSSDINSVPKGCKSNGSCGTGDCEKLSVFDWLGNMSLPTGQKPINIVEVRFKNGRATLFPPPPLYVCFFLAGCRSSEMPPSRGAYNPLGGVTSATVSGPPTTRA